MAKKIPGDVFILKADNIININLTYIPSVKKEEEKERKKQRIYRWIRVIYLLAILILIGYHFSYKILGLENTLFSTYMDNTGFWGKFLMILLINQTLNFISPSENDLGRLSYSKKDIWSKIFAFILWGVIAYFFVIKPLL